MANIAEKQHDYLTANQYRKNAAEIREKNIERETDKSVLELERKYNLAEAENKALKAQRHSRFFTATTIILILLAILLYVYFSKQKTLAALRGKQLHAEKIAALANEALAQTQAREAHTHARLLQTRTEMQQQTLSVYGLFLQQYASLQQLFIEMATKTRSKNPKLADEFDALLKDGQHAFTRLGAQLFTPDKLQEQLQLSAVPDFLNASECLILFMLACNTNNAQIASLLNTTPDTFKVRKAKLKKKISEQAPTFSDTGKMLALF